MEYEEGVKALDAYRNDIEHWASSSNNTKDKYIGVKDLVKLIESHVSSSYLIGGVKALHITKETALGSNYFLDAVEILKSKGYTIRDKEFISESRLGNGEHVGFEISYCIDENLNESSREYFLLFLKQIVMQNEFGKPFELDRPNSQLNKDFRSALHMLQSVGVQVKQEDSKFSDYYTHFKFSWGEL